MSGQAPVRVRLTGWGWRHAGRATWAVRNLDLGIEPGERVLLLGPSGAGKSTLLAALAGLLDDEASGESEGRLLVDGSPPAAVRHRVGMVFQDPDAQLVMARAGDDVAFGLENRGMPPARIWPEVDAALEAVGFPYRRTHPTQALSGGERQRLAIAGVVALRPGLLLLDEPTANLDPEGAALVRAAIGRVAARSSATVVLVEHRAAEVLDLVERVVVLEPGGGIFADGPPHEIFGRYGRDLHDRGVWVPGLSTPPRRSPAAPAEELLSAAAAEYRYRGVSRASLSDAEFTLHSGEAVAAVGPNGSGKSTLAMLLAGLRAPTSGAVRGTPAIAGPRDAARPVHQWPARRLVSRIGTVFQNPEHQFLTGRVGDELAVGPLRAGLGGGTAHRRAAELLDRLGLAHLAEANPFTLSGGEKRRLSVATALATAPRVLVLDEPTFGQDRRTWAELVNLLAGLRDDGRAIFMVTHDAEFVDVLADRVFALKDGRMVP